MSASRHSPGRRKEDRNISRLSGLPTCRCHHTAPSSQDPIAALPFPGNRGTSFGRLLTKCWYYGAPVACTFLSAGFVASIRRLVIN